MSYQTRRPRNYIKGSRDVAAYLGTIVIVLLLGSAFVLDYLNSRKTTAAEEAESCIVQYGQDSTVRERYVVPNECYDPYGIPRRL